MTALFYTRLKKGDILKKTGNMQIRISAEDKSLQREAEIYAFTTVDALKRAGLAYLASLMLLVICIPIPLVHFIAVPTLLLLGPLFAALIFKIFFKQEELRIRDAQCPTCQAALKLATTPTEWPLHDRCSECRVSYQAEILSKTDI